ncbi:MMPL family transporter [Paenibacillus sp. HJL G12]|uniref:MMPL family transporter n=1 Tax=Paenibacillus dendrobii TaxID=2691084 RepID=A0A7X3IHI7_9BACL|nr:MMPL family transporter [Paenibacillus dendrobii]MWV44054.1 MMPL family transporter [Paenibacillus dendrobii]
MKRQVKAPIQQWGSVIFRYRWAVVTAWVFLICFLGFFAVRTPSLLQDSGFVPNGSSSEEGIVFLEEKLGMSAASMDIVLESTSGENLTTSVAQNRIWKELAPLRNEPFVQDMYSSIVTRRTGEDDIMAFTVLLKETSSEALGHFEAIKAAVPQVNGTHTYITGNLAVYHDMSSAVRHDIVRAESFGIPAALFILLLLFGTLPAAVLPIAVGLGSVAVTMGSLYFVAVQGVALSNFLPNMVTMLGLAVGIDYALFMVSRFREELKSGTVEDALNVTCGTAGRSVLYSGGAVIAGLLALCFIQLPVFRSLALGGMLVVLTSVVAAATLLPALLGIMGHRIFAWPIGLRHQKEFNGRGGQAWIRISQFIMSRPALIAVMVTAALLATALPTLNMKLGIPSAEVLPPSYTSRYGADLMKKAYDIKEANAIMIAVGLDQPYQDQASIRLMKSYASTIRNLPGVHRVESYASFLKDDSNTISPELQKEVEKRHAAKGNAAVIAVVPENGETDPATVKLVQELREHPPEGVNGFFVTGPPAYKLDIMDRIQSGVPYVLVTVLLLTYTILFAAFRSVLLPLKAVVMNLLSLGASFGLITLVFQHGYGASWIQVSYTGSVFAVLPVLVFCVVFGISMDYEVMMLSRIAEAYRNDRNNERSTAIGLQRTGGMITGAALILAVVAGAFMFTDNELMKALGLGLTASVLIDVTIVRILLVPALMKLMGRANWWLPAWLSFFKRTEPDIVQGDSHRS